MEADPSVPEEELNQGRYLIVKTGGGVERGAATLALTQVNKVSSCIKKTEQKTQNYLALISNTTTHEFSIRGKRGEGISFFNVIRNFCF